jgi:3-oxoacyl-[acyl-carrier protein] reductase
MVRTGRGGIIINISSISRAGNIGQTNYAAAKAGVAAMTVTWAKELARHGIRVAGIAPGFSDTRMVAKMSPKIREKIISTIPVRRLASPDEIARAALYLASDASSFMTGSDVLIDGGYTAI